MSGQTRRVQYRRRHAKLRQAGFEFDRQAKGSHEIWRHREKGIKVAVPRHSGDMPEGTLRAIIREAGLTVEDFLAL